MPRCKRCGQPLERLLYPGSLTPSNDWLCPRCPHPHNRLVTNDKTDPENR